jgi:hypothetical protein
MRYVVLLSLLLGVVFLDGCGSDGEKGKGDGAVGSTDQSKKKVDAWVDPCLNNRPPDITYCEPPYGNRKYYLCQCSGYCGGATKQAACEPITGDCRYFANGCIPRNYSRCDGTGEMDVQGYCGSCFFGPDGKTLLDEVPQRCNRLTTPTKDGGATAPKKDGGASGTKG